MSNGFTRQEILGIGFTSQRRRDELVQRLRDKGVQNEEVLQVIAQMPRHLFVDSAMAKRAYEDDALPIGQGQTISQPYIVARMTEELLRGEQRPQKVLDVGTGSGYQAAVLAMLVEEVYTVERLLGLHQETDTLLRKMGFKNIHTQHSDGSWGWEEHAPYDAILAAAAPDDIPEALLMQLAVGGKMVLPLGTGQGGQQLTVVYRMSENDFETEAFETVMFVPFLPGQS
ncbi:MAG: protein-L-isoaspartate(D-aspartate) O-methyltransferase [Pseudomonadota bacterium]